MGDPAWARVSCWEGGSLGLGEDGIFCLKVASGLTIPSLWFFPSHRGRGEADLLLEGVEGFSALLLPLLLPAATAASRRPVASGPPYWGAEHRPPPFQLHSCHRCLCTATGTGDA